MVSVLNCHILGYVIKDNVRGVGWKFISVASEFTLSDGEFVSVLVYAKILSFLLELLFVDYVFFYYLQYKLT